MCSSYTCIYILLEFELFRICLFVSQLNCIPKGIIKCIKNKIKNKKPRRENQRLFRTLQTVAVWAACLSVEQLDAGGWGGGPYHDVLASQQEVGHHGLHAVQELHAASDVHRKAQRLVLVHHDACVDKTTAVTVRSFHHASFTP